MLAQDGNGLAGDAVLIAPYFPAAERGSRRSIEQTASSGSEQRAPLPRTEGSQHFLRPIGRQAADFALAPNRVAAVSRRRPSNPCAPRHHAQNMASRRQCASIGPAVALEILAGPAATAALARNEMKSRRFIDLGLSLFP